MSSASDSSDQLWLIVRERMSGTQDDFMIGQTTLSQIKTRGITLANCLTICKTNGKPQDFSFHIHSKSMVAAVRLLNDASIKATYELYCTKDPVVQIFVRDANDLSPNTSQCPSHENSINMRRKLSRGKLIPELFTAPRPAHVRGSSDVVTGEELQDQAEMVTIALGRDDAITLSKEYLLGWINSQVYDGKNLTDIEVQAVAPGGMMRSTKLTADIWVRSLIRGPWSQEFLDIWDKFNNASAERKRMLAKCIQLDSTFSKQCERFVYDLRNYDGEKSSHSRLDSTGHAFYLGKRYFASNIVDELVSLPTMQGTLRDDLDRLAMKRNGASSMCAAHDLAPLFESVLLVRWEKENKKAVALHGNLQTSSNQVEQSAVAKGKGKGKNKFFDTFKRKGGPKDKDSQGGRGGPSTIQ